MDWLNVLAAAVAGVPGLIGVGLGAWSWRSGRRSRFVDQLVQPDARRPEPASRRAQRGVISGVVLLVVAVVSMVISSRFVSLPLLCAQPLLGVIRSFRRPPPLPPPEDPTGPDGQPWVSSSPVGPLQPYNPHRHPPLRRDFDTTSSGDAAAPTERRRDG